MDMLFSTQSNFTSDRETPLAVPQDAVQTPLDLALRSAMTETPLITWDVLPTAFPSYLAGPAQAVAAALMTLATQLAETA